MKIRLATLIIILMCLLSSQFIYPATFATIRGRVIDVQSSQPLPGANVHLKGTNIGAATDIDGEYVILNVAPGVYTLVVNYIGFGQQEIDIMVRMNETLTQNVELDYTVLTGESVVITAQARGQTEAINQQVAARTVKNVVSSTKIQELPESNAAEAVGRLPGVSLVRNGGEGTKVMIRGMGAKYTKIQIDGVNMTATGEGDRSADLSMISPYMLEGIELTKSVMANQEATATGGIVNFKIRKADDVPSFNVIAQGGGNNLRDTYRDYKFSVGGSNRFFTKRLGVYAQVDYEEKDTGSQQLGSVSFSQEHEDAPIRTNRVQLREIFRNIQRLGGTLVLDYSLPSTEIKATNFYSRIKKEQTTFSNDYRFMEQGFQIAYTDIPETWLTVITNSLQINHQWRSWEINTLFSHSYSENVLPAQLTSSSGGNLVNPYPTERNANYNVDLDPETIPDSLVIPMNQIANFMNLGSIGHEEHETRERDLAGELNLTYKLNLSNQVNIDLNFGAKVKHKSKEFDQLTRGSGAQAYLNLVYSLFKDEFSDRTLEAWSYDDQRILLQDFLDPDYDGSGFLDGKYNFSPIFNKEMYRKIHDEAMAMYDPLNSTSIYAPVTHNFVASNFEDYHGVEDYYAGYLMPEINITSKFTFIPGVRYEANRTEYTGYRGNRLGVLRNQQPTPIDTVTKVRNNEYLLPMIQTVYKPTDWLSIKGGYTHTLQRPNYNNIMPGWLIGFRGDVTNLSNFKLKPELSRNLDLQFSIYSNKIGLLSVGAFHKKITDMIFWTGTTVILDTAYFELPTIAHRKTASYAINNPNDATNYGYEIEWQSNFWYLPGLLSGLVLNVNYTRNKSEAKYLRTIVKTEIDPITYQATLINEDTTHTAPMINQPDNLLNITVGYDYRGFSIRGAMRYKSRIFTNNSWYEKLRGYSTDFYRYDLSIKQQLPIEGLEFFLNINNITNEVEQSVINHLNYTSSIEDYGRSAYVGFRYRL